MAEVELNNCIKEKWDLKVKVWSCFYFQLLISEQDTVGVSICLAISSAIQQCSCTLYFEIIEIKLVAAFFLLSIYYSNTYNTGCHADPQSSLPVVIQKILSPLGGDW